MNPILSKYHPEWSRPIEDFTEESALILKPLEAIFAMNQSQLLALKDLMDRVGSKILYSNNAAVKFRLIEQIGTVLAYLEFQQRHAFNPAKGAKLLEWLRSHGNQATLESLERAYRVLNPPAPRLPVVQPEAPKIVRQPEDQTASFGERVIFSVEVSGTEPLAFEWYINAMSIPGATSRQYSTTASDLNDGALFKVRVSNPLAVIYSWPALLTLK